MSDYDIYVFILCLVVFLALTALSVACLWIITKLTVKLIRGGLEDQKILQEQEKKKHQKSNKYAKIIDYVVSGIVCLVFVVMLIGATVIRCTENSCCGFLPTYRVVRTGSMANKHPQNKYLEQEDLNDQIQTFDLVRTEKLPDEMDLELYDIVVYEVDGMLVIHRIVEIEEPNEEHPDCRFFRLQGDASETPDRFPVRYEQMKGIYYGDRTPFIGSFILFMQSPAGWLCTLLIVGAMIAAPIMDRKLAKERAARYALIAPAEEEEQEAVPMGGEGDV
jgi:hypothetical protein